MFKKGFDTEKYLEVQSKEILERVKKFGKLYLEFGGKICYDGHAARVLPGYDPNAKIKMLQMIKDDSEIVFCISAKDIGTGRINGNFGLSYDAMVLKSIYDLQKFGLDVSAVVINRFAGEKESARFGKYLNNFKIKVYFQKEIEGYPANVEKIVSEDGYGQNPYVETKKPIVIVTGVAPGSGKMSFCLSQMYHDFDKGIKSGYAKFETFPIWNLPIEHPVNIAYEAATADIGDFNLVDPFHLDVYGIPAINYNRDVESFPILKSIFKKIGGEGYNSPTEMGVNKAKEGIFDDEIIKEASKQEVIRRYFRHKEEFFLGIVDKVVLERIEKVMQKLDLTEFDRKVVLPSRKCSEICQIEKKGNNGFCCGTAIELMDGKIITGKNSVLLHSESSALLNALKYLAGIPDDIDLLPERIMQNIRNLKRKITEKNHPSLDVNEILIALAISADSNPAALRCVEKLSLLNGTEMHTTHLPSKGDEDGLRNLGINFTTDSEIMRI